MSNLVARGSPCVRPDICLPRLNKACPNPSKWRESLGIRGARPGYRVSALALACPFRGKRGDGSGMWLIAKRLEKGQFVWPPIVDGTMTLTPALLSAVAEADADAQLIWALAKLNRHAGLRPAGPGRSLNHPRPAHA